MQSKEALASALWLVPEISSLARSPASVVHVSFCLSFLDFLKEPSSSGSGKSSSSSGTKRKSSGSSKAAKDGKPKRAATSFMLFSGANRDKIKADDPSMDVSRMRWMTHALWLTFSTLNRLSLECPATDCVPFCCLCFPLSFCCHLFVCR